MTAWRSLRVRLVISYLVMALLMLTIAGVVFWRVVREYADSLERERRSSYYVQVHDYLTGLPGGQYSPDQVLQLLRQEFPEVPVETLGPSPGGVHGPGRGYFGGAPPKPRPPDSNNLVFPPHGRYNEAGPDRWVDLYFTAPEPVAFQFTIPPVTPGVVFRAFMLQVLAVLGFAFGLAALIGWWLSRWLSRPISALSQTTAAVAAGNYAQTVEQVAVSELDELVTQFNRMLLSVQESLRALTAERDLAKRFAADAAHELKTPLATLRAYAEVLAERPERLQQALPAVERQIDRMEYIVSGFLEIAHISEGTALRLETQDLVQAVRKLEPWLQDMVEDYGQQLEFNAPKSPMMVRLDPSLLMRLMNNLVDNACKYAQEGATVRVSLHQDDQSAVLSVADQGRGIAEADLPYVFERFRRGIDTQEIKGSGVGLAIVREAVQRLGGEIDVESAVGIGSTFRVRLPLVTVVAG